MYLFWVVCAALILLGMLYMHSYYEAILVCFNGVIFPTQTL